MSGSTRRKLRSEVTRVLEDDEGTAARTRPLSYDEIMLRRRSKKEHEGLKEEAIEAESTRHKETVLNPDRHSRDGHPDAKNNSREDSSRNKEEKTSRMGDTHGKSKHKEGRDAESRSIQKHEKDLRNTTDVLKTDSRGHVRSKKEEYSRDTTRYDNEERHRRGSVVQDRYMDRSRGACERENKRKDRNGEDEKHTIRDNVKKHDSGKRQDSQILDRKEKMESSHSRRDETRSKRRRSRSQEHVKDKSGRSPSSSPKARKNVTSRGHGDVKDKVVRSRSSSPKARKHVRSRGHDDVKDKGGRSRSSSPKAHKNLTSRGPDDVKSNGGRSHPSPPKARKNVAYRRPDNVVDKDERSRSFSPKARKNVTSRGPDDVKDKGGRSRSSSPKTRKNVISRGPDDVKDKDGRSRSSSPKARKNVASRGHDHDELSLHSQRDRSRHHSDTEWNKMSSNGSTGHHRRHGGSSSGLGGYSPRKRKTEAAVKTPSPIRSPERKKAGWDRPPSRGDKTFNGSVALNPPLLPQNKSSKMIEFAAGISVASNMGKPLSAVLSSNLSAFKQTSTDTIQLTQATRPKRRLYVDNIPGSASEKDVMECFNNFLLSSGANHIHGTRPCISCMIHKDKGQALVEFLTPEDASAALSFDGRSLSGSIVKIRRPKDFVEVATGSSEKSKPEADAISDVVKDSPHKIFVGGIADRLSSEMIMEIVSAFGPLKAYHFEISEELREPCAFFEYMDQSVTLKACAGLNGMKIGGRVVTVAQAVPNTSSVEDAGVRPYYGIPEHVKPLLEVPTSVLKLNNVIDQDAMELLSETDLEEIVEDVRAECSRFGSVVSINVVKTSKIPTAISILKERRDDMEPLEALQERESGEHKLEVESAEGSEDHDKGDDNEVEPPIKKAEDDDKHDLVPIAAAASVKMGAAEMSIVEMKEPDLNSVIAVPRTEEIREADKIVPQNCDDKADNQPQQSDAADCSTLEDTGKTDCFDGNRQKVPIQESGIECELYPRENMDVEKSGDDETPNPEDKAELEKTSGPEESVSVANESGITNLESTEQGVKNDLASDSRYVFEDGCVFVEFRRTEASCLAAHGLHGRAFDDRIVTVEYVPLHAYRTRFPKK